MNILNVCKKILSSIMLREASPFSVSVKKQKEFLESLGTPKDDIERSYYQYLCQDMFINRITSVFMNICSLPVLLFFLIKPYKNPGKMKDVDAVAILDGKPDNIIPDSLKDRYYDMYMMPDDNSKRGAYLSCDDLKIFIKFIKRYPCSWYFLLKCLVKMRMYSFEIKVHNPAAIIVCNEYSFTSSFLTYYCEKLKIKHINVMHGEKLFYIRDSFFRYHLCYVWENEYIEIFTKMYAYSNQFIVEMPKSMYFNHKGYEKVKDYTYYLTDENKRDLSNIYFFLHKLVAKGYLVVIRPHPRYTNLSDLEVVGDDIIIENYNNVTIEESILSSKYVISCFSTVLNQAHCNEIDIIIDDVTRPDIHLKLKQIDYVMMKKKYNLLSEVIRKDKMER